MVNAFKLPVADGRVDKIRDEEKVHEDALFQIVVETQLISLGT